MQKLTKDEVRAIYEDKIWSLLDDATDTTDSRVHNACVLQLAALLDEIQSTGWRWKISEAPDHTRHLDFQEVDPGPTAPVCKAPEQMTDRELLRHFANAVVTYDAARDEEIEYREDHPNRDAWDTEQEEHYKGLLTEIHAQYVQLRHLIDHINKERT